MCRAATAHPVTPWRNWPRAAANESGWSGGGSLAGNCLAAGLLDELVVSVIPHLLGAGVQLFAGGLEQRLSLQAHRVFPSGVAQLHYRVLAN